MLKITKRLFVWGKSAVCSALLFPRTHTHSRTRTNTHALTNTHTQRQVVTHTRTRRRNYTEIHERPTRRQVKRKIGEPPTSECARARGSWWVRRRRCVCDVTSGGGARRRSTKNNNEKHAQRDGTGGGALDNGGFPLDLSTLWTRARRWRLICSFMQV